MRWPWQRRPRGKQLRDERAESEARLERVQREVAEPLRARRHEWMQHNHVADQVARLITGGGESPG